MGQAFLGFLFHSFRIVLAAVAMLVVALGLWILIGLITSTLGLQSPTLVLVSAIAIAGVALFGGGYVSARYITARSSLHPMLAAATLAGIYDWIFTGGDIGIAARTADCSRCRCSGGRRARSCNGPLGLSDISRQLFRQSFALVNPIRLPRLATVVGVRLLQARVVWIDTFPDEAHENRAADAHGFVRDGCDLRLHPAGNKTPLARGERRVSGFVE